MEEKIGSPKKVQSLVEEVMDAFNRQDWARFLSFLTEDVVWSDPAMLARAPAQGKEAVKHFSQSVVRAFPDFDYRIRGPICVSVDQRRCAVPFQITGTNSGFLDPPGFAPTYRKVELQGVDLLDFREDKISRIETLFNPLPAAEQVLSLRLLPRPDSAWEKVLVYLQRVVARLRRAKPAGV
jgi:predicted ester cyclase